MWLLMELLMADVVFVAVLLALVLALLRSREILKD